MAGGIMGAPEELIELLRKHDDRLSLKLEDRVVKFAGEQGDVHDIGTFGTIKGGIYLPNEEIKECYLVLFDGSPLESFVIGTKIEKL